MIARFVMALAAAWAAPALGLAQPLSPVEPTPREVAAGVYLLPDEMLPGRGPDGATIFFAAPRGLIVVDTGRHAWRSDAILAFADGQRRPVTAIVNTHWHPDHSSGNGRIKARFPEARVYGAGAVDRALAPGGFLARQRESAPAMLADPNLPATEREETQIFLQTMEESSALRPDIVVTRSARMRIGGRPIDVHVAPNAVTDADIWLYDRRTRVAVLGDLVTFPAPFFETACPQAWRAALDDVAATPFRLAIPGHGAPMTHDQFDLYRAAFGAFIDCANSEAQAAQCASGWVDGIASFLDGDAARRRASAYADYYVGFLRSGGGASPDCLVH